MKIEKRKLRASEKMSRSLKETAKGVKLPKAVPQPGNGANPTLYSPDMREALIEAGDKGITKVQFCAKIGISKETFYRWKDAHPDFAEAVKIYEAKIEAWYTSLVKNKMIGVQQAINGVKVNLDLGGLVWFGKNVCGWTEKQEQKITVGTQIVEVTKEENELI